MKQKSATHPAESAPARPRTGGRSARVVRDVLGAALEVFAEHGYAGLSFEEVAARADVNKTTVYRRWPTKAELVGAALFALRDEDPEVPDTGSLRDDLGTLLRYRVERMTSPRGRGIARAILLGGGEPELRSVVAALRRERPMVPKKMIDDAIARGELPVDTDWALVGEALVGPIHARAFWKGEPVDDEFVARLIDLVVTGAAAGGAVVPRKKGHTR